VQAALKNRSKRFVIDGEAVFLGVAGVTDFSALYSHKHDEEVQLYAFDILAPDGDDLRQLPLSMRKTNLARLLARRPEASSLRRSRRARSGQTYSGPPVASGSKVSLASDGIEPIAAVAAITGSRSRTNSPAMKRAAEVDWSR
jgi:bifunctional non-homologous end joining protein LigD